MVPANGLLLYPEASSGCTCSFPIRCTAVLKSRPERETGKWSVFVTHGAATPVKRLAINLGAPGDRRDANGTEWFAYPRPKVGYGVKFDFHENILPGMGNFRGDVRKPDIKTDAEPWLFTSGCIGLTSCTLPLIDESWGEDPGTYTIRFGFVAPKSDKPGKRVFDIKIQGKIVVKNFDISKTAGEAKKPSSKNLKISR